MQRPIVLLNHLGFPLLRRVTVHCIKPNIVAQPGGGMMCSDHQFKQWHDECVGWRTPGFIAGVSSKASAAFLNPWSVLPGMGHEAGYSYSQRHADS
jgi:hypothetical protein